MGQHADDAINEALDAEVRYSMHAAGELSDREAYEEGLIDEHGCVPNEVMHLYNQVDDQFSLEHKLEVASLELQLALQRKESKPKIQVWYSEDKTYLPHQMTTTHLTNAIKYAEREGIKEPIVDDMKYELEQRKQHDQTT